MASGDCNNPEAEIHAGAFHAFPCRLTLLLTQGCLGPVLAHTFVKTLRFGISHGFHLPHLLYLVIIVIVPEVTKLMVSEGMVRVCGMAPLVADRPGSRES